MGGSVRHNARSARRTTTERHGGNDWTLGGRAALVAAAVENAVTPSGVV
jgi:hypothetical protein